MSKIHYRAVHTHSPWRKVGSHRSLQSAKSGPHGARSLLTGGLPQRERDYGEVICVFVWEEGAADGYVLRRSPNGDGIEERKISTTTILRFEGYGGASSVDVERLFSAAARPSKESLPEPSAAPDHDATSLGAEESPTTAPAPQTPGSISVDRLEHIGRIRLSRSFFLRDFLYSEISHAYGMPNVPDDLDLAVRAGSQLCERLLEPIQEHFGRIAIRSAFRSSSINETGNLKGHNCARNEINFAAHIWDRRDMQGRMGATACIVVPSLVDFAARGGSWVEMAWWIHDHLEYSRLWFFPKLLAFNIQWREQPERVIGSYVDPRGTLTKPGMSNHQGDHSALYRGLLAYVSRG